ncbi:prepilin-type N-terminal cleavage/methylation domain-containing protein [Pseudoalteromonas carrageenovora]|uniref:type IV pilus modification PilV family protein n=1 Tax=Pseudoalteromonas carrageenovora TaxID=227 RepID=UPI002FD6C503
MKYNKGMTLIEVLIASIILFIAVSAISFVSRASMLHEQKLRNNISRGLLAEYIKDYVSYKYEHENVTQGTYKIGINEYLWKLEVIESKPVVRFISSEVAQTDSKKDDNLELYKVTVSKKDQEKTILSFKDVYWKQ